MTDDEREDLIAALKEGEYAWACETAAAQLRADGLKIRALEAAFDEVIARQREEEARLSRIEATVAELTAARKGR